MNVRMTIVTTRWSRNGVPEHRAGRGGGETSDSVAVRTRLQGGPEVTQIWEAELRPGSAPAEPGSIAALAGIGVSKGRVVGPVVTCRHRVALPAERECSDVTAEVARASAALARVAESLGDAAQSAGGEAAEILEAQSMMVEDESLGEAVAAAIAAGRLTAEHAVWAVFEEHRSTLVRQGGYMADRAADIDDLRDRVTADLLGISIGVPVLDGTPAVLVAANLGPADTVALDLDRVLAIVVETGGPTSHTAILARALGIPAVVGCAGAADLPDGTTVVVDGGSGEVIVAPTEAEAAGASTHRIVRSLRRLRTKSAGLTADGARVMLLANVAGRADAELAAEMGAHGVGLFRTELPFLGRTEPPSMDEQADVYGQVLECFPERPVVIRTLDAGADKPLPFLEQPAEENPALGVRGWRVSRQAPEVMGTQLSAISRAARRTRADVMVMSPMISTLAEMEEFAAAAARHGLGAGIPVGMMIEVPAAAINASSLLQVADFASIGTNDLAQYTMAADRTSGPLAELNDPWQPAVLRLIAMTAEAAAAAGRPVSVCGEAASDPALACVLVGMGIRRLSMAPAALSTVDEWLALRTAPQLEAVAALALSRPTAESARDAVLDALGQETA